MSPITRWRWLIAAAVLAIASAGALALLASGKVIPSVVRNPLFDFVQPGVTIWWFVLGGPFRSAPSSATGIAFAAVTNAAFWLLVLWLVGGYCACGPAHDRRTTFLNTRRLTSRSTRRFWAPPGHLFERSRRSDCAAPMNMFQRIIPLSA
jgi:hypothetical protein